MNRSYYYKKIVETDELISTLLHRRQRYYDKSDLKDLSDESLAYLYENLKSLLEDALEYARDVWAHS